MRRTATAQPKRETDPAPTSGIRRSKSGHLWTAALQRSAGNQAVLRMISHRGLGIQTKLTVNQSGDSHEQEADRVAEQVMRMPDSDLPSRATSTSGLASRLQRKCGCGSSGSECSCKDKDEQGLLQRKENYGTPSDSAAPPIVHEVLRSPGQPLDAATREFFEPRFGRDLGEIRVHHDSHAARSAASVNAAAYTVGNHIVFGDSRHQPRTADGQRLMAHELTHVVQQSGSHLSADHRNVLPQPANDREAHAVSGAERTRSNRVRGTASPSAMQRFSLSGIRDALSKHRQFLHDLGASIKESPSHLVEFFTGELLTAMKEHWLRIVLVSGALIAAEEVIGLLTAAPEPTMLTKVVAAILQIIVLVVMGYFAAVELKDVYEEGRNWFSKAHEANGDPAKITEASKSFVRMVWHMVMAVLAVAGVRARIKGFKIPQGIEAGEGAPVDPNAGKGDNVTDIASHPNYKPHFDQGESGAGQGPTAYHGSGSAAPKLDPAPEVNPAPKLPPPTPKVNPAVTTSPGTTVKPGPGTQYLPAIGVGLSQAKPKPKKDCGSADLPWSVYGWDGTDRGTRMVANPLTRCGPQGTDPRIHLPGWKCIANGAKPPDGQKETDFWVHAHLLHGRDKGDDLHGPGTDPRNLIITDKSINGSMYRQVESTAIARTKLDQTLTYTVRPVPMASSGDKSYFATGMSIDLKRIEPRTGAVLENIFNNTIVSNTKRNPPPNCT